MLVAEYLEMYSYDYPPDDYRFKPPAAITIDNVDNSPITLRHFDLHKNMEELKKVKGEHLEKVVTRGIGTKVS